MRDPIALFALQGVVILPVTGRSTRKTELREDADIRGGFVVMLPYADTHKLISNSARSNSI